MYRPQWKVQAPFFHRSKLHLWFGSFISGNDLILKKQPGADPENWERGWGGASGVSTLASYSDTIYFTENKLQNLEYKNLIEKKRQEGGEASTAHP